jgi:hypothetical protein
MYDPPIIAKFFFDEVEAAQGTVMREDNLAFGERMGVLVAACTGGGVADVSDERGGRQVPSSIPEVWVVPRRHWGFVQLDLPGRVESGYSATVGVPVTLIIEAVWRIQKPERGFYPLVAGGEPEEAAHIDVLPHLALRFEASRYFARSGAWLRVQDEPGGRYSHGDQAE